MMTLRSISLKIQCRLMASITRHKISDNISLAPVNSLKIRKEGNSWRVEGEKSRPLLLLLEYMNAKPKHIDKFIEFYHARNFDVLCVNLKPWQLFWPAGGSQVLARQLAGFLLDNESFNPIVYHGFSVGGYLWGEVLRWCIEQHPKYLPVVERIRGQILDSGVDVNEIPTAFPAAALPKSPVMRSVFESLLRFHMGTLYNISTRHYLAAREAFTYGLIRGPVLLIYSDSDPLSSVATNQKCKEDFEKQNIKVTMKQFANSGHVMHYQKHKDEYLKEISIFLSTLDLNPELQSVGKIPNLEIRSKL